MDLPSPSGSPRECCIFLCIAAFYHWITAKGRVRNNTLSNKRLNEYPDQQEFRIYDIEKELLAEGKQVSVQEVMRRYKGVEQRDSEMLCRFYEGHNVKLKELIGKTVAVNTYKRHLTSLKLFREFSASAQGINDLDVRELNLPLWGGVSALSDDCQE